ncbi:hypothetical protein EVA_11212 [gut metagenome]|uniref:Uncharacterized protein n=1 Tax=gut metagenome TaxID=749906 RepID=J9GLN1_9ZZZZ
MVVQAGIESRVVACVVAALRMAVGGECEGRVVAHAVADVAHEVKPLLLVKRHTHIDYRIDSPVTAQGDGLRGGYARYLVVGLPAGLLVERVVPARIHGVPAVVLQCTGVDEVDRVAAGVLHVGVSQKHVERITAVGNRDG